jgi:integrase
LAALPGSFLRHGRRSQGLQGGICGLRWTDFNATAKTLRIERAVEYRRKHGLTFKVPKTKRGKRTIAINDALVALLLKVQEQHRRLVKGIADGTAVDLSLVRLPKEALIFPDPDGELTAPRHPDAVSKVFRGHADKVWFPDFQFRYLRNTHETILLDDGWGVHAVAKRRGHDPAVLLRIYAKLTKKTDQGVADAIERLTKNAL